MEKKRGQPQPYPSEKLERFIIRLPDGMRERIATAAEANNRSMNSELVARLQRSFEEQDFSLGFHEEALRKEIELLREALDGQKKAAEVAVSQLSRVRDAAVLPGLGTLAEAIVGMREDLRANTDLIVRLIKQGYEVTTDPQGNLVSVEKEGRTIMIAPSTARPVEGLGDVVVDIPAYPALVRDIAGTDGSPPAKKPRAKK